MMRNAPLTIGEPAQVGRFPSIHARQLADSLRLHASSLTAVLKRWSVAVWSAGGPTGAIGVDGCSD